MSAKGAENRFVDEEERLFGNVKVKALEELITSCKERGLRAAKVEVVRLTGKGRGTYESPKEVIGQQVAECCLSDGTIAKKAKVNDLRLTITLSSV
jgi:hypothetical protein